MTTRRALWGLIVGLGAAPPGLGREPGAGQRRGLSLPVHRPSRLELLRPPADARAWSRALGPALAGGRSRCFEPPARASSLLFAGSTWLMARLTSRFYGPRAGLLAAFALNLSAYHTRRGGHVRAARRPAAVLLAPDARPPGRRLATTPGRALALGGGRAGLGRGAAEQVPRGLPAGRYAALHPARTLGAGLAAPARPVPGRRRRLLVFSPVIWWNATHGWVSFAFQGGRAPGRVAVPARGPGGATGRAGRLPLPLDLVPAGRDPGPAEPSGCGDLRARRPVPALPGGRAAGGLHGAWPAPGRSCRTGRSWASCRCSRCSAGCGTRRWRPTRRRFRGGWSAWRRCRCWSPRSWSLRRDTGLFQQGRPGGLGLVKVVARPDRRSVRLGPGRRASCERAACSTGRGTFLFTSYWYHSGQLAFATRRSRRRSSATASGTPGASRSGAGPRTGSGATASSSPSTTARTSPTASTAGSPGSSRSAPSRSSAPGPRSARSGCSAACGQTQAFPFDRSGRRPRAAGSPRRGSDESAARR